MTAAASRDGEKGRTPETAKRIERLTSVRQFDRKEPGRLAQAAFFLFFLNYSSTVTCLF
jgi:hypothetical protein